MRNCHIFSTRLPLARLCHSSCDDGESVGCFEVVGGDTFYQGYRIQLEAPHKIPQEYQSVGIPDDT